MKSIVPLYALAAGALLSVVASSALGGAAPAVPPDALKVSAGNRVFAAHLYARLRIHDGNLFFSPYSVSTALAMTYAGARGACATEMAEVLHFELTGDALHQGFTDLIAADQPETGTEGVQLSVANALWGQEGYGFLDDFLQLTERHYAAGLRTVDFSGATESARKTINTWVEDNTQHKIVELLKPNDIDASSTLVLTNAIYFKGLWKSQFKEDMTRTAPFHVSPSKTVDVDMMRQTAEFRVNQADGVQIVILPYRGKHLEMVLLVPERIDGLADLEKNLSADRVEQWIAGSASGEVALELPRFKFKLRTDLSAVLVDLGMKSAFTPQADFSGMTGKRDLFIFKVLHEAFVEVNEEGTEAAAATGVVMTRASIPRTVRADRPFLLLIRSERTGSWLFLGRVANPAE